MRRIIALAVLSAVSSLNVSLAQTPVVIPEGESFDFTFARPNHKLPPGGEWVDSKGNPGSGNPQGYEHDPISPDDPLGAATGSDPATITVGNKGGVLSGPNGEQQNGLGEGAVIEVKVCWTYRYPITKTSGKSTRTRPYGMGGSSWTTQTSSQWAKKTVCSTFVKATAGS